MKRIKKRENKRKTKRNKLLIELINIILRIKELKKKKWKRWNLAKSLTIKKKSLHKILKIKQWKLRMRQLQLLITWRIHLTLLKASRNQMDKGILSANKIKIRILIEKWSIIKTRIEIIKIKAEERLNSKLKREDHRVMIWFNQKANQLRLDQDKISKSQSFQRCNFRKNKSKHLSSNRNNSKRLVVNPRRNINKKSSFIQLHNQMIQSNLLSIKESDLNLRSKTNHKRRKLCTSQSRNSHSLNHKNEWA